jgi:hypothetical protein
MTTGRASRRRFLAGLGGLTLSLPLLPSLERVSHAEPLVSPKRFIFVFTSNGQRPKHWYPAGPQGWTVRSATEHVREASLAGSGGISTVLGPEFDPVREKLLLLRGLDFIRREGGGHVAPAPLNGRLVDPAVTIDQVLAQSSKVYPTPPPVRSVHMLVKQAYQAETSVSIANSGPVPADLSLPVTYNRLFGDYVDDVDPLAAQRAALKMTVMDRVRGEYEALRQSPRLGAEDRQRLQDHMEMLQDLQARIAAASNVTCTKPGQPEGLDAGVDGNLPAMTTMSIDLLVSAIRCDRTRVATLMLCPGTDLRDFSFLPGGPSGDHHGLSHAAPFDSVAEDALGFIDNWYGKQVADLLTKLDVVEDPTTGATYLDNSIVYWGNEDGCNGFDAHEHMGMPVLLAGSGGGTLKTGRYVDYREVSEVDGTEQGTSILYDCGDGSVCGLPTDFKGRPYNSLLITLLQAMGLSPEDYETDGQPGFGEYGGSFMNQYSDADGQQPLPFLTG